MHLVHLVLWFGGWEEAGLTESISDCRPALHLPQLAAIPKLPKLQRVAFCQELLGPPTECSVCPRNSAIGQRFVVEKDRFVVRGDRFLLHTANTANSANQKTPPPAEHAL